MLKPASLSVDGRISEPEPRLKYDCLGGDVPRFLRQRAATRLCVSDKILALGTSDGSLHILDYSGNEIKGFKEHSAAVTDISFDARAEYVASCSQDGTLMVAGLYTDELQKVKCRAPLETVALDPRYGQRKSKEVVYGTAGGDLVLSSKGWLGNRETVLVEGGGKDPIFCARMAGTLLAWAGASGVRVYDTATHTRVGKLQRPPSSLCQGAPPSSRRSPGPAHLVTEVRPSAAVPPCTLYWMGERELYCGWGHQVTVVKVVDSPLPPAHSSLGAPPKSLQILSSFEIPEGVLGGVGPFGPSAIAVLALRPQRTGAAGTAGGDGAVSQPLALSATDTEETGGGTAVHAEPDEHDVRAEGGLVARSAAMEVSAASEVEAAGALPEQGATSSATPGTAASSACQLLLTLVTRCGEAMASDVVRWPPAGGGDGISPSATEFRDLADFSPHQLASCRLEVFCAPETASSASYPGWGRPTSSSPAAGGLPRSTSAASTLSAASQLGQQAQQEGRADVAGCGSPGASQHGAQQRAGRDFPQAPTSPPPPGGTGGTPLQGDLQYKWWREGDEPQYYIVTPAGVVVGRPRDGNDRVSWLVERQRYREALEVAAHDTSVSPGARDRVAEKYMAALTAAGSYAEAGESSPSLLGANALAWERWVYTFAQLRQLPALAPWLPVDSPRLKPSTYDLVLRSLLVSPSDHPLLLRLLQRWPGEVYHSVQLQELVMSRLKSRGGENPALLRCAALLHTQHAQHDAALRIYLALREEGVFQYISEHALLPALGPLAAELVDVGEARGITLLVEHHEEVPPSAVVASLQAAAAAAGPLVEDGGPAASLVSGEAAAGRGVDGGRLWLRRLHTYLDLLFMRDASEVAEFASLQVELYAEFDPGRLLHFLMLSPSYPLDHAYKVCEERGLLREMVYVLGRMGSADKALQLIVKGLRDVPQAVEFVQLQRDDELWGQLITLALSDADLTGALLDHSGGYIDPLRVVSRIPPSLPIPNLRSRLVTIISDFRTAMCLQQGCHAILRSDCIALANRLYRKLHQALPTIHVRNAEALSLPAEGAAGGGRGVEAGGWALYDTATGALTAEPASAVLPSRSTRGLDSTSPGSDPPEAAPWVWVGLTRPFSAPASNGRRRSLQASPLTRHLAART